MIRLNNITSEILSYHPIADIGLIEKAYVYSAKVHKGQVRLSGEPYLTHPLEVAGILTKMKMDEVSVASGLLHDTVEDTLTELSDIEQMFGKEVTDIVDGVTKISKIHFLSKEVQQAENIRKMILAMSSDIRVIIVKLADRLHNMQTLGFQPPEKQEAIAGETLDIYAPLAGRMGIYWLKSTLEDLSLFYLEPKIYKDIRLGIAQRQEGQEKFIREIKGVLSRKLSEANIKATIKGRHKHFYSIYQKMMDQDLNIDQVYDILAFRVIVNSVKDCYEVLGLIHSMWNPVAGRFKDYISLPKANMYQSLHTTVISPLGERMEIQIRTWDMDKIAQEGIAAHWRYKEGYESGKETYNQYAWMKQLLESQKSLTNPKEFLEIVRLDLFSNEVYVFTPKGEVKELLAKGGKIITELEALVDKDAEVFEPLSKAYGLPKKTPEEAKYKEETMENCCKVACSVPMEIMRKAYEGIKVHNRMGQIGTMIAISDVGCGVVFLKSALIAGRLNVIININAIKDSGFIEQTKAEMDELLEKGTKLADETLELVVAKLTK